MDALRDLRTLAGAVGVGRGALGRLEVTSVSSRSSAQSVERSIRPCPVCGSVCTTSCTGSGSRISRPEASPTATTSSHAGRAGCALHRACPDRGAFLRVLRPVVQVRPERRGARALRVRCAAVSGSRRGSSRSTSPIGPPRSSISGRRRAGFSSRCATSASRMFTASSHRRTPPESPESGHGLDVIAGDVSRGEGLRLAVSLWSAWSPSRAPRRPGRRPARDRPTCSRHDGHPVSWSRPTRPRFRDHVDAPFQEFSVEHINYFTPASLRNLLAAVGSRSRRWSTRPRAGER